MRRGKYIIEIRPGKPLDVIHIYDEDNMADVVDYVYWRQYIIGAVIWIVY